MFRFVNEFYLWLLILIPIMIIVHFWILKNRAKNILKLGDNALLERLMPNYSKNRFHVKFWIFIVAIALIIFSLSRPQFGSKIDKAQRKGVDLMVCFDVSRSMLAEDIQPSRIERSKQAMLKMIDQLNNDRIGIVVFAGKSFIQLPITNDYGAAKMFIDRISTDIVEQQGTSIGSAIDLALSSFNLEEESPNSRAIIVITDGENFEDDAISSAEQAIEKKVRIHAIGVGTANGSPIPVVGSNGQKDYHRDQQGNVVVSKLDEAYLQKLAATGKGIYVRASNSDMGLSKILDEIDKMDKKEYDSVEYTDYDDAFYYFLALALILLFVDGIILPRKNKFANSIKLFKHKHL